MICPVCRAQLDDDSKFCAVCGSRIDSTGLPGQEAERPGAGSPAGMTGAPETSAAKTITSEGPAAKAAAPETSGAGSSAGMTGAPEVSAAKTITSEGPAAKTAAPYVSAANKEPDREKDRRIRIIGLAAGTIFIVIGFIRIATAGTSISSTSFGADFYTYTYQGIVAVAEVLARIEVTLGWILVAVGAAIDLRFLRS